ncbi:NADPH2:quinone reductase [Stella humosa]|uniref:NADPH2:quinone reductase n=1 Tax=Stella humosa TaxID=94 RepID=A0A3N1KSJ9_9PROT|nr:quinone oxidoreductase [Stella humosa]ROP83561.1 NADPH2:quinone reductase [Stella humosa]BBK33167.1 quinone oxidoreductase [Stella humosa]
MATARVVRVRAFGGPEVMEMATEELAPPGAGQAQVRHAAIGINFIDISQRKGGGYPLPLPTGLGHEAAGVVEAVGPGVEGLRPGDRVAYINAGIGAYADRRVVAADRLVPVPDTLSDEDAAALIFKGMTAQYLLRKTHRVAPGEVVFVHAAAGGVGLILSAWAKALGAVVVGGVGSEGKRASALAAGCDHVVVTTAAGWPERMLAATGGRKARVVYDSVGRDTLLHSLDCAAPFGLVVVYGGASGPAPAIEPELLNRKGCLFLTRPSVFPHNADPADLRANAAELFAAVAAGAVTAHVGARYALADVADAHRAIEGRQTVGATVLVP